MGIMKLNKKNPLTPASFLGYLAIAPVTRVQLINPHAQPPTRLPHPIPQIKRIAISIKVCVLNVIYLDISGETKQ